MDSVDVNVMLRNLLVTTDFSETSRHAFATAADLAREFEARLYLLHLAQGPPIYTPWQLVPESPSQVEGRRAATEKRLMDLAQQEPAFAGVLVEPLVLKGETFAALEEFKKTHGVDLFIIASHGHTDLKRFLLGSFAARVLKHLSCPVLVLRVNGKGRQVPVFRPRRILAPHDFSSASNAGLEAARRWAQAFRAAARLLFVVNEKGSAAGDDPGSAETAADRHERSRADGLEQLRQILAEDWQGVEADAAVRVGHPAEEILKEAEDFGADLVIMASRGLSLLPGPPLGSVAESVIHGAPSPVLVVKGPEEPPRPAVGS